MRDPGIDPGTEKGHWEKTGESGIKFVIQLMVLYYYCIMLIS